MSDVKDRLPNRNHFESFLRRQNVKLRTVKVIALIPNNSHIVYAPFRVALRLSEQRRQSSKILIYLFFSKHSCIIRKTPAITTITEIINSNSTFISIIVVSSLPGGVVHSLVRLFPAIITNAKAHILPVKAKNPPASILFICFLPP